MQAIPAFPSDPGTLTQTSFKSKKVLIIASAPYVDTFSPFHLKMKVEVHCTVSINNKKSRVNNK